MSLTVVCPTSLLRPRAGDGSPFARPSLEKRINPIIFEALLVQTQAECLRVILGPYCLEFAAADVEDVQELPPPAGLVEGSAIAARVTLQAGARVMRIASADAYHALLWKPRLPFALASRPNRIFETHEAMKRAEEAFFAARGLRELLP